MSAALLPTLKSGTYLFLCLRFLFSILTFVLFLHFGIVSQKKTGTRREIRINKSFQDFIRECYVALKVRDISQPCFLNRFGSIITNQMVNRPFKLIKVRYQIKTRNFSTHSLRKTFGRRVVDLAGSNAEMALIKLSEIFNHVSPLVTRRYLGLRQEELGEVYESLMF